MEHKLHELTNITNIIEVRNQKLEARSQKKSCFLPIIISCLLLLVSCFLFADDISAKECTIMEPEVLKRYIGNKSIYNMVIFDVRPQLDIKMKRIPRSIRASLKDMEREFVGKVDELIGEDVILVGENTESAEKVCKNIIKKNYGIRNIYILKGGMDKWDGPVAEDISTVECEPITSRELINIMKSDKKVEIIDRRSSEEYHEGHIPGAVSKSRDRKQPSIKSRLQKQKSSIKWEQENITIVYVYPDEFQAIRDCRYAKYFSWGYKDIYLLRGGMKTWEGEVEKDYLEILKSKVKERLK